MTLYPLLWVVIPPANNEYAIRSRRPDQKNRRRINLPPSGKKIGFNLLDDADFTIPYITVTIPNSPADHQLPEQAKRMYGS